MKSSKYEIIVKYNSGDMKEEKEKFLYNSSMAKFRVNEWGSL